MFRDNKQLNASSCSETEQNDLFKQAQNMRQRMLNGDNGDNELSNKAKSTKTALREANERST